MSSSVDCLPTCDMCGFFTTHSSSSSKLANLSRIGKDIRVSLEGDVAAVERASASSRLAMRDKRDVTAWLWKNSLLARLDEIESEGVEGLVERPETVELGVRPGVIGKDCRRREEGPTLGLWSSPLRRYPRLPRRRCLLMRDDDGTS